MPSRPRMMRSIAWLIADSEIPLGRLSQPLGVRACRSGAPSRGMQLAVGPFLSAVGTADLSQRHAPAVRILLTNAEAPRGSAGERITRASERGSANQALPCQACTGL